MALLGWLIDVYQIPTPSSSQLGDGGWEKNSVVLNVNQSRQESSSEREDERSMNSNAFEFQDFTIAKTWKTCGKRVVSRVNQTRSSVLRDRYVSAGHNPRYSSKYQL